MSRIWLALIWKVIALCMVIQNLRCWSSLIADNLWDQKLRQLILLVMREYFCIELIVGRPHCRSWGWLHSACRVWVDSLMLFVSTFGLVRVYDLVLFSLIISQLYHIMMSLIFKILKLILRNLNIIHSTIHFWDAIQVLTWNRTKLWVEWNMTTGRLSLVADFKLIMICVSWVTLN